MPENELHKKEVLEIIENLRTLKRQLKLLRTVDITEDSRKKLFKAIARTEEEMDRFQL